MQVKNIDEFDMKILLKECPKPIQSYVKSLKDLIDNSGNLRDKQTRIIREQALEITQLKSYLASWISVKEKLPNEGELILCYDPTDRPNGYIWIMECKKEDEKYKFECPQEGWSMEVSHWMPLPKIPQ